MPCLGERNIITGIEDDESFAVVFALTILTPEHLSVKGPALGFHNDLVASACRVDGVFSEVLKAAFHGISLRRRPSLLSSVEVKPAILVHLLDIGLGLVNHAALIGATIAQGAPNGQTLVHVVSPNGGILGGDHREFVGILGEFADLWRGVRKNEALAYTSMNY